MKMLSQESAVKLGRPKAQILVVDDHPIFLQGLVEIVSQGAEFQVCAQASSAKEAVALLAIHNVHIAVLDISMPGANGIELTKQIKATHPEVKVLILSMYDESLYAMESLRA